MLVIALLGLVFGAHGLVTMPLAQAPGGRLRPASHRQGAAYASALARLANQNLADADPEPWVE